MVPWVEASRWIIRGTAVGPCSVVSEVLYDELRDVLGQMPHHLGMLAYVVLVDIFREVSP